MTKRSHLGALGTLSLHWVVTPTQLLVFVLMLCLHISFNTKRLRVPLRCCFPIHVHRCGHNARVEIHSPRRRFPHSHFLVFQGASSQQQTRRRCTCSRACLTQHPRAVSSRPRGKLATGTDATHTKQQKLRASKMKQALWHRWGTRNQRKIHRCGNVMIWGSYTGIRTHAHCAEVPNSRCSLVPCNGPGVSWAVRCE